MMDRAELQRHIHEQFQDPIFQAVVLHIDVLLDNSPNMDILVDKVHDANIDAGDKCPDTDPYCVLLWCLNTSRLITYQEWLRGINVAQ